MEFVPLRGHQSDEDCVSFDVSMSRISLSMHRIELCWFGFGCSREGGGDILGESLVGLSAVTRSVYVCLSVSSMSFVIT